MRVFSGLKLRGYSLSSRMFSFNCEQSYAIYLRIGLAWVPQHCISRKIDNVSEAKLYLDAVLPDITDIGLTLTRREPVDLRRPSRFKN